MENPHSVNRRRAWAQISRRWLTVEDTDLHSVTPGNTGPATHLSLQNDLIMNGCSTGKIETWLQNCGYEVRPENPGQLTVESLLKTGNSFDDDLSLGAEATALGVELQDEAFGHCPLLLPPPKSRKDFHTSNTCQQRLSLPLKNMGHSMASSVYSATTNKTASSVSEALQMCAEDAEETLYQLGFGCEEPQVTARIPARFFNFPSQLRGINFRLFLESQLRRIREEDPGLSLASRFRQVEVLTTMANAFYSLYSHVSRTPLQKLAPPEFSFSSPTVERSIGQRFFTNVRTEPRSPVERLKDTVSKMCLYTGSRGSDSASPSYSPRKRSSLPDVVDIVLENARAEDWLDPRKGRWFQEQAGDLNMEQKMEIEKVLNLSEVKTSTTAFTHDKMSTAHKERILRWSQSGQSPKARVSLFTSEHTSLDSVHTQKSRHDTDIDECSVSSPLPLYSTDTKTPVGNITSDLILPHIKDHLQQASSVCQQTNNMAPESSPTVQTHNKCSLRTLKVKPKPPITDIQSQICPSEGANGGFLTEVPITEISQGDPVITQGSPCQIMVTGWEDDASIPQRDPSENYTSFMHSARTALLHSCPSDNQRFLSPTKPSASLINSCLKQVNSFELEEVQSVGEEENTTEQCSACTLSVTASPNQKCFPLKGDSFQSDSSGYAEEDMQHSYPTSQRDIS